MGEAQATIVSRVQLFLYQPETGSYAEYGTVGCAIMGTPGAKFQAYRLGCYTDAGEYVCTAPIGASNDSSAQLALQGNGYANFRDDGGKMWSMLFASEPEALQFGAHFTVAMYGASNQPEASIITCDVGEGKKDKLLFAADKVKARYHSWVVQKGSATELPRLGSSLETNESDDKPYLYTVPPNHNSVSKDMKGFEGMTVGMAEEGKRFIVVPIGAKKGAGPNVHMCFYVNVLRKKETPGAGAGPEQAAGGFAAQGAYGGPGNMYGTPMNPMNPTLAYQQGGQPGYPLQIQQQQPHQLQVAQSTTAPAELPAPPPQPTPPPPPPPGFSPEQLELVDRMRDQVGRLMMQMKDVATKVDLFSHDFRQHANKTKPMSLGSAQLEHTIKTLIVDTESMKEELTKRDEMLRLVEEKNKDLQRKADKFSATANQLADEKKAAITSGSDAKLELDRQLLSLQTQLTRVMSEREDVARHLSTVKKLLEVSDQDTKAAKGKLQVAEVTFGTNEAKMSSMEENLHEERSRRKIFEGKCVTLGAELRGVQEEVRTKEGQIDERKRKMEADKLHYAQLMEEERQQSAQEMREMRQELLEELASRDRRYQAERVRVANEAFERGRQTGMEDGYNDSMLEADAKVQKLTLDTQRCRSELESMKIKLRQVHETAEADKRRLEAQSQALSRVIDDLGAQNSNMSVELGTLSTAKEEAEEQAHDRLLRMVMGLSRPVRRAHLLGLVHSLRGGQPLDYSFEPRCEAEEARRIDEDREEVLDWVRRALHSTTYVGPPPRWRTKAPEEVIVAPPERTATKIPAASGDATKAATHVSLDEPPPLMPIIEVPDPEAVQARYRELLSQLSEDNPTAELLPPPREPTPPPPREPTPEPTPPPREPTPPPRVPTPRARPSAPAREDSDDDDAPRPAPPSKSAAKKAPVYVAKVDDDDDEDDDGWSGARPATASAPAPKVGSAPPKHEAPHDDDDDDDDDESTSRHARPAPKSVLPKRTAHAAAENDEDDVKPAATVVVHPKRAPVATDDEEEEAPRAASKPAAPEPVQAQPEPEAEPEPAPVTVAPAAKKAFFQESDDDSAAAPAPAAAPARPPTASLSAKQRAAPAAAVMFASDSDDEPEKPLVPAPKVAPKKVPPKKHAAAAMFGSDSDEEKPPAKAPAKKQPIAGAKRAVPLPKKKTMFDSESD